MNGYSNQQATRLLLQEGMHWKSFLITIQTQTYWI